MQQDLKSLRKFSSPFGVTLSNRDFTSESYRYGFQNQERDDELKGPGNSLNFTHRMHDTRLGRFFAIDPLSKNYPHNSTYAFSENRVLDGIELEGLEYAPYDYGLSEEDYENELIKPEIKVANTWYVFNEMEGENNVIMQYVPMDGITPYANNDGNYINIYDLFFSHYYNNGVIMNNEFRKSILHHEYQHKLNAESGKYPGAYVLQSVPTDIVYYEPYTEEDKKIMDELKIKYDPQGQLTIYRYTPSVTLTEHRDVYKEQLKGHYEGLYTLTNEQIKELEDNVKSFEKGIEMSLQYEKDKNLNPDGTEKK